MNAPSPADRVDLDSFDPAVPEIQQCPYPHYRAMRDERPVLRIDGARVGRPGENVFLVSRHDDAVAVLRDWATFSSRFGTPAAKVSRELVERLKEVDRDGWPNVSTMLTEDPPAHTRYRKLVSAAFTPRRVAALEPEIRAICEDLVDGFGRAAQVDFLESFAVPLPVRAVAAILEVPDDHRGEFKRWADASVAAIGRAIPDDERVAAQRLIVEQQHWFAAQIEDRRLRPRDDFLTDLVNAELPPGDDTAGGPLDMAEMLSIIRQIQVAGSETTTSLLADLMVLLAREHHHWEAIRADRSRIGGVVEEALRVASPNQGMFRIATRDAEIAGVTIPAGATLWVMFGSANRDDRVFSDPDRFDPDREELGRHVAFGKGIHVCLGAALARLEARVALETLVDRLESFSVPEQELRYAPSWMLRGLAGLRIAPRYR
jgi:cytochrome P450